jgi:hypothetical protein
MKTENREPKTETKGAQLADDLADLFPLVPDSDRWGSYYNQSDEPGDDSIDAWQQREARFLSLVNAAPELLEALKASVRDWETQMVFTKAEMPSIVHVRAAIAKATGQN